MKLLYYTIIIIILIIVLSTIIMQNTTITTSTTLENLSTIKVLMLYDNFSILKPNAVLKPMIKKNSKYRHPLSNHITAYRKYHGSHENDGINKLFCNC